MAAKKEIWDEARAMYQSGISTREISKALEKKGIKLNQASIYKKSQKENWTVCLSDGEVKTATEKKVSQIIKKIEMTSEFQAVKSDFEECFKGKIHLIQRMNNILTKGLALKDEVLDKTLSDFRLGLIDSSAVAKIISNLGLSLHAIARVTGLIQEDDSTDKKESAIKVYMPENSRDIKQVH